MSPTNFDPGPLATVEYEPAATGWTLVFTRDLSHSPEKVWASLTQRDQLARWAPFVPDRDLVALGDATFTMEDGSDSVEQPAHVLRSEAPSVLEYRWEDDLIRWELEPAPAGTRLTLRHTHHERDWLPKLAAGWHLSLVVAERLLEGRPIPRIVGEDAKGYGWGELSDAYAAQLEVDSGR
jgi:uncharacterized protein YndB with AHSA1/START domain